MTLEFKIADQNVGGPPGTPQSIRRLRRQNYDWARYIGEPVVVMHRFNEEDVDVGVAKQCPACFDNVYGQVRKDCMICFGVGFVSIADDPNFWIDVNGQDISTDPASGIRAPLFGGFDQPYVTFLVEPDTPTDIFKIDQSGGLVRTKQAQGFAPWTPALYDNDLCINVVLDAGKDITATGDRFLLKMVEPVTIRGFGRQQHFQEYLVAQQFEMARIVNESTSILYRVPHSGRRLFKDSSTIISVAFGTAITNPIYIDQATIRGTAIFVTKESRTYDEGNFVNSVGIPITTVELHTFSPEAAIVTSVATTLDAQQFNGVDASTMTAVTSILSGDVYNGNSVDAATVTGNGVETAAVVTTYVSETPTVTSVAVPSASEAITYVIESSTETSAAVASAVDIAQFKDALTTTGVTLPGSTDSAAWNPDAGTVIGATFLLALTETDEAPGIALGVAVISGDSPLVPG